MMMATFIDLYWFFNKTEVYKAPKRSVKTNNGIGFTLRLSNQNNNIFTFFRIKSPQPIRRPYQLLIFIHKTVSQQRKHQRCDRHVQA